MSSRALLSPKRIHFPSESSRFRPADGKLAQSAATTTEPGNDMIRRTVTVMLENGLHMVPASEIAKEVRGFDGHIVIRRDQTAADPRSVLDLLQLKAECGAELEVEADGEGADQIVDAIARLFALNFTSVRPVAAPDGRADLK